MTAAAPPEPAGPDATPVQAPRSGPHAVESVLALRAVDAWYGRAQILFGVDLTVQPGEVLCLLGRNGAGKSTTLRTVMGLVGRVSGEIRVLGHAVRGWPTHRIARLGLGYVPEDRRIFTDLTVLENLEVGARPAVGQLAPWTIEALFHVFPNLAALRHRQAGQISGGEQQMLAIARTLMGNPRAVLLDEPSEGLAPVIVDQMAEAVGLLKAQGVSILLSEQNLSFAMAVADRLAVIETGRIRWTGSAGDRQAAADILRTHLSV